MVKDFLCLIDSFNLVQSVSGPTQERGHTLDLVLSFGLPVRNLEICDAVFSDHMPVLFDIALACNTVETRTAIRPCRIINPSTAVKFTSVLVRTVLYHSLYVMIQRRLARGCTLPVKLLWILWLL